MDHFQGNSGDYAMAAASDANRAAKNNADRIAALEKEVARLWRTIERMQKEARRK